MEEKNNIKVEYQIGQEYLNPSCDAEGSAELAKEVNEVIRNKVTEISATNEEAKEVYEEAYANRYEYFVKKKHLTPEKADKKARAVAAHTTIMSSLDTRRDYIMTDYIEYENLKNYDVYIPTTIVGNLRHPILIKQVYKTETEHGDDYQVSIEWYDEDKDELCTDVYTPIIKSPEFGSQWSGDVIVPYEIAVALKDCYDKHFGNKEIDKTFSRSEHYYIHKYFTSDEDGWSYDNGDKCYKQGDLVTGQELRDIHNTVVGHAVVYAPTYLDLMNWLTKCSRKEYAFTPVYDIDNECFTPLFMNAKHNDISFNVGVETYEKCCIDTINEIFKQGGFHPFYTWYDEKLTNEATTKIFQDGFWTAEECEIYTGHSPIMKTKHLDTEK